jgi:hypothetical protein
VVLLGSGLMGRTYLTIGKCSLTVRQVSYLPAGK